MPRVITRWKMMLADHHESVADYAVRAVRYLRRSRRHFAVVALYLTDHTRAKEATTSISFNAGL